MFNEKLKAARKQNGLSQAALGKLIGVRTQTISNWETGKSEPNLETINKLCEILNIPLYSLISKDADYQLNYEEAFIVNKFRELNDDGKQMIINLLNMIKKNTPCANRECMSDTPISLYRKDLSAR